MHEPRPHRRQSDLADLVEMLLDKGIVVNADIVVSVGDTELIGISLRAAIASFDTAAKYGLEFPEGTNMKRLEEQAGLESLPQVEEGQRTLAQELEVGMDSSENDGD